MRKGHEETRRAQHYALTVALSLIVLSGFLVFTENPGYAVMVSGATIVGVITAFLRKPRILSDSPERQEQ